MPTTIQALVIIALVISPGYVFARVAGDVIAFADSESDHGDLRFLLPTVTAGTFIHLLMSFWTVRIVDYYRFDSLRNHPVELVLWGATVIFAVPVVLGIGLGRFLNLHIVDQLLDRVGLGYVDRMPSAWDYVMRLERPAYVRVYLTSGQVIGGEYASQSFASTVPNRADLYLEQLWQLDADGEFLQPIVDNWGVWISQSTIERVEFFDSGEDDEDVDLD